MSIKTFLIIFFLIIETKYILSLEININPSELRFIGKANNDICKNYSIYTDKETILEGKLRWSRNLFQDRNIINYKSISESFEIKEKFQKQISSPGNINQSICLSFKEPGDYQGALYYYIKDKNIGVGVWINAYIIKEKNKKDLENYMIYSAIFLIIIFSILIFLNERLILFR
ncbi:MAG: hypothetical protein Q8N99_03675 [Nanoarchaeota archaeon]|nr:hypothetical protein [Nanoarchaeota archaeon]